MGTDEGLDAEYNSCLCLKCILKNATSPVNSYDHRYRNTFLQTELAQKAEVTHYREVGTPAGQWG